MSGSPGSSPSGVPARRPPGRAAVRAWGRVAGALLRSPGLWPTTLSQLVRLARRGWWRRPPYLPLPDPAYLRYRLETAYGSFRRPGPHGVPEPHDVIDYLRWCRTR